MATFRPAPITSQVASSQPRFSRVADTVKCRPGIAAALIVLSDGCAVLIALLSSVLIRHAAGGDYPLSLYFQLWPVLLLFAVAYGLSGLYPGVTVNYVAEIRRSAAATTGVFLILSVLTFLLRVSEAYSRLVFLMAWAGALVAVPLFRALVRKLFSAKSWWGYPVIAFGGGRAVRELLSNLRQNPQYGLRPVAIVDPQWPEGAEIDGVPVCRDLESAWGNGRARWRLRGIVSLPGMSKDEIAHVLNSQAAILPRLLIVPGLEGVSSLDTEAKDIGQLLMLETRNRLLLAGPCLVKRLVDVTLAVIVGALASPLLILVAAIIKLESRGPVFYGHDRIGRGGQPFKVWKFRTMVLDASQVLEAHLQRHPILAAEWRLRRKLANDPRVTRAGRILRRTSLDELPQLWNVLRGEMSLVGPRPIIADEVQLYKEAFALYLRVRPGLTGLWQVSGRNDTTYAERVGLDTYYVRNWSPWLDLYVLARTVTAVLGRAGAY